MADYYSILKKTVSGLPAASADTRKLVYAKARTAIDRQLRAISPQPSEEAISRQLAALEAAIERLESESLPSAAPPAAAPARPVATAQASPQASGAAPAVVAAPPGPAVQSAPNQSAPAPVRPPPAPAARVAPAQPAPQAAPQRPPEPKPVQTWSGESGRMDGGRVEAPAYDNSLDAIEDFDRPVRVRASPSSAKRPVVDTGGRSSNLLTIIVLALVVSGLIGGGAYALWRNKAPLLAAMGLGSAPAETPAEPAVADGLEPVDGAKEETRLGDAPIDVTAKDAAGTDEAENGTPPADATEPSGNNLPLQPGEAVEPAAGDTPVQPVEETPSQQAQAPAVPSDPAAAESQPAQAAIGQKAYLYEEGASGAGATRDNAAVVWSLEQLPPADGVAAEAAIKGKLDVPGRGLVMDILIKRNVDEALPASHIIELFFQSPADFSGGSIDNVARFVMKASEQARGEGLVAVPAKIDSGYFLIALNNLEQAKDTNKRLLLESSWIDIPLGYTTGRRALVTLEKGAIGDKVFKDAFADWDKR